MHAFQTDAELYGVLEELFEQLKAESQLVHDFAHSNLVVRIRLTDPVAEILLDGRQPPIGIFYGISPGDANFEVTLEAQRLHNIWLKHESLLSALFNGDIQTKGNIIRAQPFIDLLQRCGDIYQAIWDQK